MRLVISREYNEDPVFASMAPATWLAARRRTILLFFDRGDEGGIERLAVSRYPVGSFFAAAWNPEQEPDQWRRLTQLIEERDPRRIAIDTSETFALADGLTASERTALEQAVGEGFASRLQSAEALAIRWLETRIPAEMESIPPSAPSPTASSPRAFPAP